MSAYLQSDAVKLYTFLWLANLMAFLRAIGLPVKRKNFSLSTTGMEENAYEMTWGSFPGDRTFFGFRSFFNPSMWTLRLEIIELQFSCPRLPSRSF